MRRWHHQNGEMQHVQLPRWDLGLHPHGVYRWSTATHQCSRCANNDSGRDWHYLSQVYQLWLLTVFTVFSLPNLNIFYFPAWAFLSANLKFIFQAKTGLWSILSVTTATPRILSFAPWTWRTALSRLSWSTATKAWSLTKGRRSALPRCRLPALPGSTSGMTRLPRMRRMRERLIKAVRSLYPAEALNKIHSICLFSLNSFNSIFLLFCF